MDVEIFPAKHFVTTDDKLVQAISRYPSRNWMNGLQDSRARRARSSKRQRLKQRTMYDLEMLQEAGYCSGIENYSMHLSRRRPASNPPRCSTTFRRLPDLCR